MKQEKTQIKEDERLFKIIIRFFPGLLPALKKFFSKFENFDFSQPKTFMRSVEKDFHSAMPNPSAFNEFLFLRFIRRFLVNNELIKQEIAKIPGRMADLAKKEAKKDSRYSLLLELIYEAESNFPFSPYIMTARHGDIQRTFEASCSPVPYLENAKKLKGELRASNIYEGMRRVCEFVYKPYIQTLWQLSYLRDGEEPPFKDLSKEIHLGDMINVALQKFPKKYHSLIDPDAAIMRNSASHHDLEYDIEQDSIVIRDKNKTPISIKVDTLIQRVDSMYLISSETVARVGQIYLFRLYDRLDIAGEFYNFLPEFLSMDKDRAKLAEQNLMISVNKKVLQDVENISKRRITVKSGKKT